LGGAWFRTCNTLWHPARGCHSGGNERGRSRTSFLARAAVVVVPMRTLVYRPPFSALFSSPPPPPVAARCVWIFPSLAACPLEVIRQPLSCSPALPDRSDCSPDATLVLPPPTAIYSPVHFFGWRAPVMRRMTPMRLPLHLTAADGPFSRPCARSLPPSSYHGTSNTPWLPFPGSLMRTPPRRSPPGSVIDEGHRAVVAGAQSAPFRAGPSGVVFQASATRPRALPTLPPLQQASTFTLATTRMALPPLRRRLWTLARTRRRSCLSTRSGLLALWR